MSDMSRPYPLPTAPDHELHDPLLVAQHAAGDALGTDDQRRAESWVTTCGACAALASELRALSGAVAWEPTPPRRRDFRISVEQAEHLRGNPFSRLMRRLALPEARALRPAAAAMMSLGLVLVAAGTVWPGDGLVLEGAEPAGAPAPLVVEQPMATAAPVVEAAPDADTTRDTSADQPGALDTVETQALDEAVLETAEVPAAASFADDAASKAAQEGAEGLSAGELGQQEGAAAEERALRLELENEITSLDGTTEVRSQPTEPDEPAELAEAVAQPGLAADAIGQDEAAVTAADATGLDEGAAGGAGSMLATSVDDGVALETLLIAGGVALAAAGALLLLVVWLARRRVDPLLR